MPKKTKRAAKEIIELDPILPLPAGTGIPPLKQGQGKEILTNTTVKVVELPYRAFYQLWEHAEAVAANQYQRYVGGPLDHAAQAALEAVRAFREVANDTQFPNLSEEEARKIRSRAERRAAKKQKVDAEKMAAARAAKRKGQISENGSAASKVMDKPTECPKCGPNRMILPKKSKETGKKIWRCCDCGHRWPRRSSSRPSVEPSKASEAVSPVRKTTKGKAKRQAKPEDRKKKRK